jgi:hypothetical protein
VLLFQTYNIILYVHSFLFCCHFSYRTCAFCKAHSDWLQLPLAALHLNRHRMTSKIRLTMPRVKMSRADRNPWLAKMGYSIKSTINVGLMQSDKHSWYLWASCLKIGKAQIPRIYPKQVILSQGFVLKFQISEGSVRIYLWKTHCLHTENNNKDDDTSIL